MMIDVFLVDPNHLIRVSTDDTRQSNEDTFCHFFGRMRPTCFSRWRSKIRTRASQRSALNDSWFNHNWLSPKLTRRRAFLRTYSTGEASAPEAMHRTKIFSSVCSMILFLAPSFLPASNGERGQRGNNKQHNNNGSFPLSLSASSVRKDTSCRYYYYNKTRRSKDLCNTI